MSDFDESGRRVPDSDEYEEAHEWHRRIRRLCCPQCGMLCGREYPGSPATYDDPGSPSEIDVYEGAVESSSGDWFCSEKCRKEYEEDE